MSFSQEIIRWYMDHKRDLPWRHTKDPYVIWLSEVILQQTRVDQGLPYFNRFAERFPNVASFAQADEGEILRLWQGLGYYSRARNMHHAAKMVMERFDGVFPSDYHALLSLKGVGGYTAAAISSFSINTPRPVLDGNVSRVLSRYSGMTEAINSTKGKKILEELAENLMDKDNAAIFNQAIMEFGALQCKPSRPDCEICPIQDNCEALRQHRVDFIPVKLKAAKSRNRYFFYFVLAEGGKLWMNQRGSGDIWEKLYELPLLEIEKPMEVGDLIAGGQITGLFGDNIQIRRVSEQYKHVLSHQNLYARFIQLTGFVIPDDKKKLWNSFFIKDLDTLAKPKLIFSFLREYLMNE
ncbi:A/G-specific DNA-adenine glycosylase [bacterium A37T11]|nr:A/G-specific DNA-adenine glycosylase [bacterium A37T11]